jgi:hypothetical protein
LDGYERHVEQSDTPADTLNARRVRRGTRGVDMFREATLAIRLRRHSEVAAEGPGEPDSAARLMIGRSLGDKAGQV